ncbi:MAG: metal-dependent hydrolase [Pseudomonadota bacterium]
MDPVTQGLLGGSLPRAVATPPRAGMALLCGVLAGMAPDLDVVIRSKADPLLFLEYHRHFTHSLIFIPFGAAIVAGFVWLVFGRRRGWPLSQIYFFCALGYGTHALLDACTTYGTQLFWPFTNYRVAWNNVSVVDPAFTLPILVGLIAAQVRCVRWPAIAALFWGVSYLSMGVYAKNVAEREGLAHAELRGHRPDYLEAKPSLGNLLLWKVVYRTEDRYYVDAVRLGFPSSYYPGENLPVLDRERDFPWLQPDSVQAEDLERFRWFSSGFIAIDPDQPLRVIDLRYSLLPNQTRALWGIELDPTRQQEHAAYVVSRTREPGDLATFWRMLRGKTIDQ